MEMSDRFHAPIIFLLGKELLLSVEYENDLDIMDKDKAFDPTGSGTPILGLLSLVAMSTELS
jgi:hypothetical protein